MIRETNTRFNLDLKEPNELPNDGLIEYRYCADSQSRIEKAPIISYVTNVSTVIGIEVTYLDAEKIEPLMEELLGVFADEGIAVQFESATKPISDLKIYEYAKVTMYL